MVVREEEEKWRIREGWGMGEKRGLSKGKMRRRDGSNTGREEGGW